MRAISAVDSVSPAIQRTRDFLFRPFNWGTYLKLGLVAIITEGGGSSFNSSSHHGGSSGHGPMITSPFSEHPEWIVVIAAAVLLAMMVALLVFYLITRLRFAFFHCLIHNTREIRPGWQMYGPRATRFFWLNVAVGFCFLLVVMVVVLIFGAGFWNLYREYQLHNHFDFGLMISLVLPLIPIVLLLALAGIVADVILRDWMMPHYALEDATAGEAWSQVWLRMMAEKRQFFVYGLLRVILPTVAMAGLFMVLLIPGLFLAGSYAAFEYGLHSAFAGATGGAAVAGIVLQAGFGALAIGLGLLASICLGGPISTGLREYALIFYGGRYQALGNILYPAAVVSGERGIS